MAYNIKKILRLAVRYEKAAYRILTAQTSWEKSRPTFLFTDLNFEGFTSLGEKAQQAIYELPAESLHKYVTVTYFEDETQPDGILSNRDGSKYLINLYSKPPKKGEIDFQPYHFYATTPEEVSVMINRVIRGMPAGEIEGIYQSL